MDKENRFSEKALCFVFAWIEALGLYVFSVSNTEQVLIWCFLFFWKSLVFLVVFFTGMVLQWYWIHGMDKGFFLVMVGSYVHQVTHGMCASVILLYLALRQMELINSRWHVWKVCSRGFWFYYIFKKINVKLYSSKNTFLHRIECNNKLMKR